MRRLTLLLVSLVLLSIQSVLAQSFSVKGTVVSAEDNEPMIGVTIMQEGTSNGVVTDIDGKLWITSSTMPVRLMVSSTVVFQSSQPVTSMLAILLSQVLTLSASAYLH